MLSHLLRNPAHRFPLRHVLLGVCFASLIASRAGGQPPAPPPPAKYQATLRYAIDAPRDQHVASYDAMVAHLQNLGFEFQPPLAERPKTDREDRTKNTLQGLLPGSKVAEIFENPHIATALLIPEGAKLPDKGEDLVRVRIDLAGGFPPDRQRELAEQVKPLLARLGFHEEVGYDRRGRDGRPFTRLVGVLPSGRLPLLLKDLRRLPSGWFLPRLLPDDLPSPLARVAPLRVVEVLPDPEPVQVPGPPAAEAKEGDDTVGRWEIILVEGPDGPERTFRALVDTLPEGVALEGHVGSVATVSGPASAVKKLRGAAMISVIRPTRPVRVDVEPALGATGDNPAALKAAGLDLLHKQGFRGKKVRLVVLDRDFRQWQEFVKEGKLPGSTRLIDLTPLADPDFLPASPDGKEELPGHGTQCARAAALAAPEVDLLLVRFRLDSPYQIADLIRATREDYVPQVLARRRDELLSRKEDLLNRRNLLLRHRSRILDDFTDERTLELEFGFLGPVYGWVFSDRTWLHTATVELERLEKEWATLQERLTALLARTRDLGGADLVVCTQGWGSGYPLGGVGSLARWLDDPQRRLPLWFQAAGDTRGQSWVGHWRDPDGDRVLNFAPESAGRKPGRWTDEVNFLAWRGHDGKAGAELPIGLDLRLSLQWREAHDPDYFLRPGEADPYERPLAPLRLVLLRQRDPEGKVLPADLFEVVARAEKLERLDYRTGSAVFELSLRKKLDKAGRYAVRIERLVEGTWVLVEDETRKRPLLFRVRIPNATGLRPADAPTLPDVERNWELNLHLMAEAVDDELRLLGRPVWDDFADPTGRVGTPGDARSVFSVAAANPAGKPREATVQGPPPFLDLAPMPSLLAFDGLELAPKGQTSARGSSVAASFAAGTAAALLSSGMDRESVQRFLRGRQGKVLQVR